MAMQNGQSTPYQNSADVGPGASPSSNGPRGFVWKMYHSSAQLAWDTTWWSLSWIYWGAGIILGLTLGVTYFWALIGLTLFMKFLDVVVPVQKASVNKHDQQPTASIRSKISPGAAMMESAPHPAPYHTHSEPLSVHQPHALPPGAAATAPPQPNSFPVVMTQGAVLID